MKGLDTGTDKVKKICDLLKKETLEPAQEEAHHLLETAKLRAQQMIAEAERHIEAMNKKAEKEREQKQAVFEASLAHACRQTLEVLKEKIVHKLFNPELSSLLLKPLQETQVVAKLIEVVVQAIEKEGISADLSVAIASIVPAREVAELLGAKIVHKLKEKGVLLSTIGGGIEVKMVDRHLTIDLSDSAFKELVAEYVRKDFHQLIFGVETSG